MVWSVVVICVHAGSANEKVRRCSPRTKSCVIGSPNTADYTSQVLQFESVRTDVDSFAEWEDEWRRLEQEAANGSVYTTYDWLLAWAEVYRPRRLQILRAV